MNDANVDAGICTSSRPGDSLSSRVQCESAIRIVGRRDRIFVVLPLRVIHSVADTFYEILESKAQGNSKNLVGPLEIDSRAARSSMSQH